MKLLLDNLYLLPFISAALSALYEVAMRAIQREKDCAWSTAFLGSWLGALALAPLCISQLPPDHEQARPTLRNPGGFLVARRLSRQPINELLGCRIKRPSLNTSSYFVCTHRSLIF